MKEPKSEAANQDGMTYEPDTGKLLDANKNELGWLTKKGYRRVKFQGKNRPAHCVAWFLYYGVWPSSQLDHKNRIKPDNRISNLRPANNSQQQQNCQSTHAASGARGVRRTKYWKWRARIKANGQHLDLGTFDKLEDARNAYQTARRQHFGQFAP